MKRAFVSEKLKRLVEMCIGWNLISAHHGTQRVSHMSTDVLLFRLVR